MAQRRLLQTGSEVAGKTEDTPEIIKEEVAGENASAQASAVGETSASEVSPAEEITSSPAAPEEANAAEETPSSAPQEAAASSESPSADSSSQQAATRNPSVSATRRNKQYIAPEDRTPTSTLYVGNLFFEVTEADLRGKFEQYGDIKHLKIIKDHRELSKGFGYVEFATVDQATKALMANNLQEFEGRRMAVQYQTQRPPRSNERPPNEPSRTLYIGNMSYEMSDRDMNDLFRNVRNCLDVRVAIDRNTGNPRGFAHADFVDVESATRAKEMLAGKEVYGRTLRVDYTMSKPKEPGQSRYGRQ